MIVQSTKSRINLSSFKQNEVVYEYVEYARAFSQRDHIECMYRITQYYFQLKAYYWESWKISSDLKAACNHAKKIYKNLKGPSPQAQEAIKNAKDAYTQAWHTWKEAKLQSKDLKNAFYLYEFKYLRVLIAPLICTMLPAVAALLKTKVEELQILDKTVGGQPGFIAKTENLTLYFKFIDSWQDAFVGNFLKRVGLHPNSNYAVIPAENFEFSQNYMQYVEIDENPINLGSDNLLYWTTAVHGDYLKNGSKEEKTFCTYGSLFLQEPALSPNHKHIVNMHFTSFIEVLFYHFIFDLSDLLSNDLNYGVQQKLGGEFSSISKTRIVDFTSPYGRKTIEEYLSDILCHLLDKEASYKSLGAFVLTVLDKIIANLTWSEEGFTGHTQFFLQAVRKALEEDEAKLEASCQEAFKRITNPRVRLFDETSQRYICAHKEETTTFDTLLQEEIAIMKERSRELLNCQLFDWEKGPLSSLLERYAIEVVERLTFLQTLCETSRKEV